LGLGRFTRTKAHARATRGFGSLPQALTGAGLFGGSERGSNEPGFGGDDVVYHPVPASRVQHSRNVRFLYHTPDGIRAFTYAEIRDLPDLA
jgi:hypothetical protein